MEQLIKLTEFETKMNDCGDAARLIILEVKHEETIEKMIKDVLQE